MPSEVRAAVALAPGNPEMETALAEALLRAHDLDEALPLLERLTRSSPDDTAPPPDATATDSIAHQEFDRAIPILEAAVKGDATVPAAQASLGRAYMQAGRFADAVPHLEAASADDANGDLHLQLARAYQALQRADEARSAMAEYQKRHSQEAVDAPTDVKEEALTPP